MSALCLKILRMNTRQHFLATMNCVKLDVGVMLREGDVPYPPENCMVPSETLAANTQSMSTLLKNSCSDVALRDMHPGIAERSYLIHRMWVAPREACCTSSKRIEQVRDVVMTIVLRIVTTAG